jgi:chromosome partitioning protein
MGYWIISAISQKGGTHKSTFIRAIAKASKDSSLNVKVADLDTLQWTTAEWHTRRLEAGLISIGSVECFKSVAEALKSASASPPDILLIDSPARASRGTLKAAEVSHLAIHPATPCIDVLKPAVAVFRGLARKGVDKKKLVFVLSGVGTKTQERDAREYLDKAGFHVMRSCVMHKTAYENTHNQGKTILETPFPWLNAKADRVVQEIFDYLEKNYG